MTQFPLVGCVAVVTSSIFKRLPLSVSKVVLVLGPYFEDKGPTPLRTIPMDDGSRVLKPSPLVDEAEYIENT